MDSRPVSSRPNWDSTTPSHAGECVSPIRPGSGEARSLAGTGWGGGGPNSNERIDTVAL
jgi:hypothetical protein